MTALDWQTVQKKGIVCHNLEILTTIITFKKKKKQLLYQQEQTNEWMKEPSGHNHEIEVFLQI